MGEEFENDQTIDEGEDGEEGEEAKYGLSGEFNRQSDSCIDGNADNSGMPLVDQESSELSGLNGEGAMIGSSEAEYAEIDAGDQNDIFEQDNCKSAYPFVVEQSPAKSHFSSLKTSAWLGFKFESC